MRNRRTGPVRAGVIGSGAYGTGLVAQAPRVGALEVPIIADADLEAACSAYAAAGEPPESLTVCATGGQIADAWRAGKKVITPDPLLLMDLSLDVIVESTGSAESGARCAAAAIAAGKHVVMVNKEAHAIVGALLHRRARRAGVIYTAADGDQPGLMIGLVEWARSVGLRVLCAGKGRDSECRYHPAAGRVDSTYQGSVDVPDDPALQPQPRGPDADCLARRRELLGDLARSDNWDLVELTIAANGTGLRPDGERPHGPPVYLCEIHQVLRPAEDGGVLREDGVVDQITVLGLPHEAGLGGGVFVVVDGGSAYGRKVLRKHVPCHVEDGSAATITRPYHLLGMETIHSVLMAGLYGLPTGTRTREHRPDWSTAYRARRDLSSGEIIGGHSNDQAEAIFVPGGPIRGDAPVPADMLRGHALVRDVPAGTVLTCDCIDVPEGSDLWRLRAEQDALFYGAD
mgnify:CR=1 FL=1